MQNGQRENAGIIEEDRLFNNLLSSQPLCFNFFGELYADHDFGLLVLKTFYKDLTKLNNVLFEFAPIENFTNDRSAFDVAFEVKAGDKIGLIGLECKYTDTFSTSSQVMTFIMETKAIKIIMLILVFTTIPKQVSQNLIITLFGVKTLINFSRNQLIAEALLQNKKYDFVCTGLFVIKMTTAPQRQQQTLKQCYQI